VDENKPGFVVNTVLPDTVFGKILDRNLHVSTAGFVNALYKGEQQQLPPRKCIILCVTPECSRDLRRMVCRCSRRSTSPSGLYDGSFDSK
jgi:hypothetical protein